MIMESKEINTPTLEDARNYIENMDLECVFLRLVLNDHWISKQAHEAIKQYKRYLILMKKYGDTTTLSPSEEIDEVWHNHILFTRKYIHDCQCIFGKYLHHEPDEMPEKKNASSQSLSSGNFEKTKELYRKEFHENLEPIKYIWPIEKALVVINKIMNKFQPTTS
jgi:hypothetical protein